MTKDKMEKLPKIVAVDFDGTLVSDQYPEIGDKNKEMFQICQALKDAGIKLILWTCRDNNSEEKQLDKAVEYCKANGLEFDAVNQNIPETIELFNNDTRKVYADLYIDDKIALPWQSPLFWSHHLDLTWNRYYKRFTHGA